MVQALAENDDFDRLSQAARELGLTLEPVTLRRLLDFGTLLLRWNRVYNLTALRAQDSVLTHHLIDCLAILPALRRHVAERAATGGLKGRVQVVDVGSGGGLPGAVLALVQPEWQVLCVDSVGKKVAFVRQVAAQLGLPNLQAWHGQVQSLRLPQGADVVTSRAFASLADFTAWTGHLLGPGAAWLAMKGRHPEDELKSLPASAEMFHVEPLHPPGLDAERCLVWLRPRPSDV